MCDAELLHRCDTALQRTLSMSPRRRSTETLTLSSSANWDSVQSRQSTEVAPAIEATTAWATLSVLLQVSHLGCVAVGIRYSETTKEWLAVWGVCHLRLRRSSEELGRDSFAGTATLLASWMASFLKRATGLLTRWLP